MIRAMGGWQGMRAGSSSISSTIPPTAPCPAPTTAASRRSVGCATSSPSPRAAPCARFSRPSGGAGHAGHSRNLAGRRACRATRAISSRQRRRCAPSSISIGKWPSARTSSTGTSSSAIMTPRAGEISTKTGRTTRWMKCERRASSTTGSSTVPLTTMRCSTRSMRTHQGSPTCSTSRSTAT